MSKYLYSVAALLVLIASFGCTTRYYPQPTDKVSVVDDYAIVQSDGVSFAVSARAWRREPQRVNDHFTTFHIIVINKKSNPISISPSDIILFDEERNQYDALTYNDVAGIILRNEFIFPDMHHPMKGASYQKTDERLLGRAYLMQDSFHYGDIVPNARKAGYIFFRRISPKNNKATIQFRGQEIDFIRK